MGEEGRRARGLRAPEREALLRDHAAGRPRVLCLSRLIPRLPLRNRTISELPCRRFTIWSVVRQMAKESGTVLVVGALAGLLTVFAANADEASTTSVPIRLQGTEAPVLIVRVQGQEIPLQLDLGDE